MTLVQGYIFRMTLWATLAGLGALTGVIWVTQSLRQVDLLTTKGQTLVAFLLLTGLTIPSLIAIIAPIALFIGVLYALNRLNGDSELVVMSASGMAPGTLLRPFAILMGLTTLLVFSMTLWAMPASFRAIRDVVTQIRADFLTRIVREGTFTSIEDGFIFHYRERGPGGSLLGIFIQDRRDPDRITTYLAETGATIESGGSSYLVLQKGSAQRQSRNSRDPALVVFESYAIDLAQFGSGGDGVPLRPRERSTPDMFRIDPAEPYYASNVGNFRSELHDRFAAPLYALVMGAAGFAALGRARTTRQGRSGAMITAILFVVLLRIAGFGASALVTKTAWAIWLVYGLPILGLGAALFSIFGPAPELLVADIAARFRRPARAQAAGA